MSIELKSLREDNQYINSRMQKLSNLRNYCRGGIGWGKINPGADDSGVLEPSKKPQIQRERRVLNTKLQS